VAAPIILSPTPASPTVLKGLQASVTFFVSQDSNSLGISARADNPGAVSIAIFPGPSPVVGQAVVGQDGGTATARLTSGYNVTITALQAGSTSVYIVGDGGQSALVQLAIFEAVANAPFAPTIASVAPATQGSKQIIVASVTQSRITGGAPIVSLNLYRAPTTSGPFILIDTQPISPFSVVNQLFDRNPPFGVQQFYFATAVDSLNKESGYSLPVSASLFNAVVSAGPFPAGSAALGPYPLLGSDYFLDPASGECVIGPNGDYLAVNGLYLLAQDLGIRLRTEVGELALHPSYGFGKGKVIGRGQGLSDLVALELRNDVVTALFADPRVSDVVDVVVSQNGETGWLISYVVIAIGVEDPLKMNQVIPYSN